jgi:group II intron reverse transcriptase/maturase
VFADSPSGSAAVGATDVSVGKAFALHAATTRNATGPTASAAASGRLLDEAASLPNLAAALLHVARNKGACGVDGMSVEDVVEAAPTLLPRLSDALLKGRYRPGDVRRVWIPKPGGGQRGLGIPNVVDRVVQQAVHQVLEPVFEPAFHGSSHGFRRYRGAPTAIAEASRYVNEGYTWVVGIDLSKFFDRVNHQRLLSRMAQRVADERLLVLVHRMLVAKVVMPDGTRVSTEEGTPQGGPLSPLLSNIVLDELDWELDRRGLRFVRYADDFNVYVRSERAAHRVMASLSRFIEGRLRLKVNADKSEVARPEQVHLLGFSLLRRPDNQGVDVLLSRRTHDRLAAKIRALTPRNWGLSLEACMGQISTYVRGWVGYFRLCARREASRLKEYDAHIRRRVRAIVIRQRKRARFLYRHLRERGVSRKGAATTAFGSRGPWNKSKRYGIHKAYQNAWFATNMASLLSEWMRHNPPPNTPEATNGQLRLPGLVMSG